MDFEISFQYILYKYLKYEKNYFNLNIFKIYLLSNCNIYF